MWLSEPLTPGDDGRAGLLLFSPDLVRDLFQPDVEDDAAYDADSSHNQNQTLSYNSTTLARLQHAHIQQSSWPNYLFYGLLVSPISQHCLQKVYHT